MTVDPMAPKTADEPADITVARARTDALAAADPLPKEQAYELFDECGGQCSPPLPVQITADRFTYVSLITLNRADRPATLPAYKIVDREALRGLVEPNRQALLAAAPLVGRWEPPEQLRAPAPMPEVVRVALDRVLADRAVTVAEDTEPVPLSLENVRALLALGRTVVKVGADDERREVIIVAEPPVLAGTATELVVPVADVAAFLAAPRLPGGAAVRLEPDQVGGLLAGERVEVEAIVGKEATPVTLVRANPPLDGIGNLTPAPVATWSPASSARVVVAGIPEGSSADPVPAPDLPPGHVEAGWQLTGGYEFVLWCPYRQVWTLLGYTRGSLLNSIPLAPQEETTIEIFSWDRRSTDTETTTTDETETSTSSRQTIRDSNQVVREAQRQRNWTANGKGNIGVNWGVVNLGGEAGGSIGKQLNDNARRTHDEVVDATDEATQRTSAIRQTRVSETAEIGSETRVTRTLRNANMTRTLTFDYFEILASHKVETRLDKREIRLCVLADDVLPGEINRYFVLQHEGALRAALTSDVYAAGFDAVRLLAEFEATCSVACGPGCECEEPHSLCETPTVPSTGQPEPAGTTRCQRLPLPPAPETSSVEICRDAAGVFSVRLFHPLGEVQLVPRYRTTECPRFLTPLDSLPFLGRPFVLYVEICPGGGEQVSVSYGTGAYTDVGFTRTTGPFPMWTGMIGANAEAAALQQAVIERLDGLAAAVLQLELASAATVANMPQIGVAREWIRTVHTYLYRTLALERACPAFWDQIRAWAHAYQRTAPQLTLLRQALREPRERLVTMAMLPHAMLGEYAQLIRDTGRMLGYPRSDLVARNAGFFDQGFESALAGVRAALAAQQCPEAAASTGGSGNSGVAGGPLGSGNWSVEELARRLLNPILWTVEKLYEGWTTDEGPPDLSYIEKGGLGAALTASALRIAREGPLPTRVRGYNVTDIAHAVVAEQQLLGHLSANEGHYRQAVWAAMEATDRFNLLSARGDQLLDHVENEVIGFVGRSAVLPFRLETDRFAAGWMRENVIDNAEFAPPANARTETVPTKGITVQARLGACDTGEEFVMDLRRLEVLSRQAEVNAALQRAAQEKQETRRRKARLDANPPDLHDPVDHPGPIRIELEES